VALEMMAISAVVLGGFRRSEVVVEAGEGVK
jgi:hypothetical protein